MPVYQENLIQQTHYLRIRLGFDSRAEQLLRFLHPYKAGPLSVVIGILPTLKHADRDNKINEIKINGNLDTVIRSP